MLGVSLALCVLLLHGASVVDTEEVSVMVGDSVTLNTDVETNHEDRIMWYFNNVRIVLITGNHTKICTDAECPERFRDRLKLDYVTASLTITNINTTDSGVYHLQINNRNSEKVFSVAVHDAPAAERDDVKSVQEGESVTLDPGVINNPYDSITWLFNGVHIAEISGDPNKTCTGVQCENGDGRFRDRLEVNQTGFLTVANIKPTDSGVYQLHIISSSFSIRRIRSFSVTGSGPSPAASLGICAAVFLLLAAAATGVIYCLNQENGSGVSGGDTRTVSVMEGDSVTFIYLMEKKQQEDIMWCFNSVPIAEITGDPNKICTDARCDSRNVRFRDRVKLDNHTGSLTITNARTTDSGLYDVWISRKKRGGGAPYSVVVRGVSGVDADEVSLIEGDSVTLHTGVKTNQQEKIKWYFNDIRIAQISVDQSKICTDVQCKDGDERFRGRLKLDKQTGSLTVKNLRTSDAGLYKLQIINRRISITKQFGLFIISSDLSGVGTEEVSAHAMKGDSVILNTDVKTNQQNKIKWFFNDLRIAQINRDLSKTCTDVKCNDGTERFSDRLKLDHQTGSLTITNINTTDSGLYQLEIISDTMSIMKHVRVCVHNFSAEERDQMRNKSVKETESVTLDPGEIKNLNDSRTWHFNDILIAKITGNQSKICTDDQCKERFRDSVKVHNTTSLTITNMKTSDSGLYKLTTTNIKFSIIRSFNVSVTAAAEREYSGVVVVVVAAAVLLVVAVVIYFHNRRRDIELPSNDQVDVDGLSPNQAEVLLYEETSSNQSDAHAADEMSQ
ncbi:cell adhesion molecule CEACAM3-like [Garra rufa]|uniref:cell adhesion molecule CEACAM3-like n=1 Tax=Garra rufa TaxID=137080 RepID=UPI003CCE805C